MAYKAELVWIVILRMLTVASLVASTAVLATDQFTNSVNIKTTFKDVTTYKFVLAIAGLGVLCSFSQIPFSIYHVLQEKRFFRSDWAPEFDFYCDKIMSWLLASSVGAGFAVTYEFKKGLERFNQLVGSDEGIDFLDRAYVAIGLSFLGFLCVAIVSILSSPDKAMARKSKGFFG